MWKFAGVRFADQVFFAVLKLQQIRKYKMFQFALTAKILQIKLQPNIRWFCQKRVMKDAKPFKTEAWPFMSNAEKFADLLFPIWII